MPNKKIPEDVRIPLWTMGLLKMAVPVILALAGAYAVSVNVKRDVEDGKAKSIKIDASVDNIRALIQADSVRIDRLESRQAFMDKSITDTLGRIESDIKDVKRDVKELQLKVK